MEHAMLPTLRLGNTFTSKTKSWAQRSRTLGGGIDLVFTNGVFCTSLDTEDVVIMAAILCEGQNS